MTMTTTTERPAATVPWVEKYRPRSIDDVAQQEEVVRVLKKSMTSRNLPHLLFYGPPGTGKTSTILALARELYGPELFKRRVLELNASDERGINVVREKIRAFAQETISTNDTRNGVPVPPYRIIILDEADSMTRDAQTALRRTMETYSKLTRFCIICNYVSRIIEPLASRCAKFRFRALDGVAAKARLEYICREENVQADSAALDDLLKVADGDLRKAVMYLQSAARAQGAEPITVDVIHAITGAIPDDVVANLLQTALAGPFERVEAVTREIVAGGYSAAAVVNQLLDQLLASPTVTNESRALIAQRIGQVDKALIDGADEHLQLLSLATFIMETVRTRRA